MAASRLNLSLLVRTVLVLLAAALLVVLVHSWQMRQQAAAQLRDADELERDEQPAALIRALSRSLSFDPTNAGVRSRYAFALADNARQPGERWKALQVLRQVLQHDPQHIAARVNAAELARSLGEPEEAIKYLRPALERQPDDADLLTLLGRCQRDARQNEEAAASLRKALEHTTDQLTVAVELASLYRGPLDRPRQADAVIDRLVRDNPRSTAVLLAAARYQRDADRLDQAAALLARARQLAPDDTQVVQAEAELAERRADWRLASETWRQLRRLRPDQPFPILRLARLAQRAGRPGDAEQELRDGLQRLPDNADLLYTLADLLIARGERAEAQRLRDRLPPAARGKALGLAGHLARADGDLSRAARDYWSAVGQRDLSREQAGQLLLALAECCARLGARDEQLFATREAVRRNPSPEAQLQLADLLLAAGRPESVIDALRRLTARPGTPPRAHTLLARALVEQNRRRPGAQWNWAEAEAQLDRAARDVTEAAEAAIVRADMLSLRGLPKQAREVLDRAVRDHADRPAVLLAAADLMRRQGDEPAANAGLQRGDERFRANPEWWRGRADRAANRGLAALAEVEKAGHGLTGADQDAFQRQMGALFLRLGDTRAASRLATALLGRNPNDAGAGLLLFEALLARGDEAAAAKQIDRLRSVEGADGTAWRQARVQWLLRRAARGQRDGLDEARRLLVELHRQRPQWTQPLLLQGQLADLEGNDAEALARYREVLDRGDPHPQALRRAVTLLTAARKYPEAAALIDRSMPLDAGDGDLLRMAAWLALQTGKPERARDLAVEAVPLTSASVPDLLWRGLLLDQAGRATEAEDTLRAAIRLAPDAVEPRLALVGQLARSNRSAAAARAVAEMEKEIDAEVRPLALAQASERLGRLAEAEQAYLALARQRPRDTVVLQRLAALYLRLDEPRKAEGVLAALLDRRVSLPEEWLPEVRRKLALVLSAPQQPVERVADALRLLELNRRGGDAEIDRRVEALVQGRRPELRAASLQKLEALAGGPAVTPEETLRLAQLYDAAGRWPEARAQLLDLTRRDATNPAYAAILVDGLLRHGKMAEAATWIDRLEKLDPQAAALPGFKKRLRAPAPGAGAAG